MAIFNENLGYCMINYHNADQSKAKRVRLIRPKVAAAGRPKSRPPHCGKWCGVAERRCRRRLRSHLGSAAATLSKAPSPSRAPPIQKASTVCVRMRGRPIPKYTKQWAEQSCAGEGRPFRLRPLGHAGSHSSVTLTHTAGNLSPVGDEFTETRETLRH